MAWRKKPKKLDLSATQEYLAQQPQINFQGMSQFGPAMPILPMPEQRPAPLRFEEDWKALGIQAWRVLRKQRMRDLFRDETVSEFERYLELIQRSPAPYHEEIFIGLEYRTNRPMFVPRFIFERHGYILGASGSGKTTHGLAQLLLQLGDGYRDARGTTHLPPPMLIIDLKQNGDRYLRALASRIAERRGQKLQFFSNDPDYESLLFDPLYCLRHVKYPIKMLETLLKAFSMIYPEGYGSDFFTNEQRVQLMEILYNERPTTMDELIRFIRRATRGKSGNTDARGLYSALAALQHAMHLHTDGSPTLYPRIDFERFFDEREILYVHLDSRSMSLLSRDIGKLILFALLETASQREKQGRKVQAFVAIDEFHRLAARNIVEMLEDARSAGVGFLLAHQSSSSLVTRDADLYGTLFENCSFKQCLTLEDERVIARFQQIAGRVRELRRSGSSSQTNTTSHSKGRSSSYSKSQGVTEHRMGDSATSSETWSWGETAGEGDGESREDGESWQEEMISGLTPEMITTINDNELASLVHIKGAGDKTLTPTGGIPIVIQGLFPFLAQEAQAMTEQLWPLKPVVDVETYYHSARPVVPVDDFEQMHAPSEPSEPEGDERGAEPLDSAGPRNEGEERELEGRIKKLAVRLADHMLKESVSAQRLARTMGVPLESIFEAAKSAGLQLTDKNSPMTAEQVEHIKRQLSAGQEPEAP